MLLRSNRSRAHPLTDSGICDRDVCFHVVSVLDSHITAQFYARPKRAVTPCFNIVSSSQFTVRAELFCGEGVSSIRSVDIHLDDVDFVLSRPSIALSASACKKMKKENSQGLSSMTYMVETCLAVILSELLGSGPRTNVSLSNWILLYLRRSDTQIDCRLGSIGLRSVAASQTEIR